jgi:hypothetical protein
LLLADGAADGAGAAEGAGEQGAAGRQEQVVRLLPRMWKGGLESISWIRFDQNLQNKKVHFGEMLLLKRVSF